MEFDVSLEMHSDSKKYVSVQDDEITELVHTIKSLSFDTAICETPGHGLK